jgi:hypothetical protein
VRHYQEHIESTRKRLAPIIGEMAAKNRTVFIRGTIGEPSIESILRPNRSNRELAARDSIPFHCGSLHSFKRDTAVLLVDASLRRSISYALFLFLRRGERTDVFSDPADFGDFEGAPPLLLAMMHEGNILISKKSRNEIFEKALVGDKLFGTLYDVKLSAIQVDRFFGESEITLISMPPQELQQIVQSVSHDPIERMQFDSSFSAEDYKSWMREKGHGAAYRIAVKTEILMMERMLKELEKIKK